jgi:hypothetical protein
MVMRSPHFLNVDLDIESRTRLSSLAAEFGQKVDVNYSGRMGGKYLLVVEIPGCPKDADRAVNALCGVVEGLSALGKRIWDAAHRKEFDLGYEARFVRQHPNRFKLRTNTLRRITRLGATMAVTFYCEDRPPLPGKPPKTNSPRRRN